MHRAFLKITALLLICLCFMFCSEQTRHKKTVDINDITGKTTFIPLHPAWGILDRDTTIEMTKHPKLIVYFSSNTCMSCAIKELKHWKETIAKIRLLQNKGRYIDLLFILDADKTDRHVKNTIIEQEFAYPIMYDIHGEFKANNILPENDLMHVFFLNADNKVVFVGNPLISLKHEKVLNALIAGFDRESVQFNINP